MKCTSLVLFLVCPLTVAAQQPPVPTAVAAVTVTAPVDPIAGLRDQRLTGRTVGAAGQTFAWGGGTYRFASGTFWEIAGSDGTPVGLFFEGAGALSWAAGDDAAARVYADNAKRVGGPSVAADRSLEASFSRASFYSSPVSRPRLPELAAAAATAPAEGFRQHRKRFLSDREAAPETGAFAGAVNGTGFTEALLEAGKDYRHRVDGTLGFEETLALMDRPSGKPSTFPNWRFAAVVGRRPVGHPRRTAPAPEVRLVDVGVDVRETEVGWGRFVVEETLAADRGVRAVALVLRSEVLLPRTLAVVATRFTGAATEDGRPVPAVLDKDTLLLILPEAMPAGASRKITFRYDAPFLSRPGGENVWELQIANAWYPQPVAIRSAARHTFRSVVRAKKPLVPFASGETVRRAEDGDWNLVETRLARPVPFVAVLAGAYTVKEETQDGVVCRVASYGISKEKSGAKLTNLFHKMRKFYEPYFGAFPWKEYTILEVPSYGFGQAPPGMMRITREAFQSNVLGDEIAAFFSGGINERLAHEIAHSWWGYGVWGATENDQWIEETFAEVSAGRLLEEMKDRGDFTRLANIWRTRAKDASSLAPIHYANDVTRKVEMFDSSDVWADRYYLTYFKGSVLLQSIRKEVGEDTFFTVLKSFQRSFEKKPAVTTDEFIGLLSFVTKKDWKPWFEKYYYGSEMP
jgi:hypothetical protein